MQYLSQRIKEEKISHVLGGSILSFRVCVIRSKSAYPRRQS